MRVVFINFAARNSKSPELRANLTFFLLCALKTARFSNPGSSGKFKSADRFFQEAVDHAAPRGETGARVIVGRGKREKWASVSGKLSRRDPFSERQRS